MNYFKLLLLLSGALISISGTCFSAAAAEESIEEAQSLDEAVLASEQELPPKVLILGDERRELTPKLWSLSAVLQDTFKKDKKAQELLLEKDNYLVEQGIALTEIYDLLSAVSDGNEKILAFFNSLSMPQLLKMLKVSHYLDIQKKIENRVSQSIVTNAKNITEALVQFIAKKTIETSDNANILKKTFSYIASFFAHPKNSHRLNPDLEKMLIKNFETRSELFEARSVLRGHTNFISSVAWSPDSRQLAFGSWDKAIKILNPATGQLLRMLKGHTESVFSVAWSPDGRQLASGSEDKTVRLWSVPSSQELLVKMYSIAEKYSQLEREQRAQATAKSGSRSPDQIALPLEHSPFRKKEPLKQKSVRKESAAAAAVSQETSDDSDSSDDQLAQAIANSLKEEGAPIAPKATELEAVGQEVQSAFSAASNRSIHEEKENSDDEQPAVAAPLAPAAAPLSRKELQDARMKRFGHLEKRGS